MDLLLKSNHEAMAREITYKLLSEFFDYPMVEWDSGGLIDGLAETLASMKCKTADETFKIQEYFKSRDDYNDLHVAYAKLFVGPQKLLVPPYGSVYLDDGRRVMGDSTMAVINFYKKIGIKVSDKVKEMPDHIRIELEVMYYLLFKERYALNDQDIESAQQYQLWQKEFFVNFLYPWIKEFAQRLEQVNLHQVYTSMGMILNDYMDKENKYYNN